MIDLKVRTKAFALRAIRLYATLPTSSPVAQVIGRQLLRSGTSIGANYREAFRARSKAEFISKIGDCLKEAEETEYWLELLIESGTLQKNQLTGLLDEVHQLIAILVSISKTSRANPS